MDDELFMTKSLNVTSKTTKQNLVVHSCKSEAAVTNNKRRRSRYYTVEAGCRQTQSIVWEQSYIKLSVSI